MNYSKLAKMNKEKAVALAGGPVELSKKMTQAGHKITRQGITYWSRVPLKHLIAVSRISGVPVQELVPECGHEES